MHAYLSTTHQFMPRPSVLHYDRPSFACHGPRVPPARRVRGAISLPPAIHPPVKNPLVFGLSMTRAKVEMQGKGATEAKGHSPTAARSPASDDMMYAPRRLHGAAMAGRRLSFWCCRARVDSHHTNLSRQQACEIPSLPMPTQSSLCLMQPKPVLASPTVYRPGSAVEQLQSSLLVGADGEPSSGFMLATLRTPWRRPAP